MGLMFQTRLQLPTPSLQPTPHAHPSNDIATITPFDHHLPSTKKNKKEPSPLARRLPTYKHVQGSGLKVGEVVRVVVSQRHRQLPLQLPIT